MSKIIRNWTKEDDDFLRKNNNEQNSILAEKLGRTLQSISTRKKILRITRDKYDFVKDFKKQTPNLAYALGFIFADGHLFKCKNKSSYGVTINIVESDAIYLDKSILSVSNWMQRYFNKNDYTRKKQAKPQKRYIIHNKDLFNFLYYDLEFKHKNEFFSSKIFEFLPENLHRYFWRGFFDGDGCIYTPKDKGVRCYIAGSHDFNWQLLTDLCDKLSIYSHIKLQTNHTGGWSHFVIHRLYDCEKFINFIYGGVGKDGIGFTRKYIKYIKYLENKYTTPPKKYANNKNAQKMFFNINGV